jgi:hypothetical protein
MEEKHEEQVKILDEHANVSLSIIVFTLIYPSTITYVYIISLKSQLIVIILYVDRRWVHANCSYSRTCTKKSVQHLPFWRT